MHSSCVFGHHASRDVCQTHKNRIGRHEFRAKDTHARRRARSSSSKRDLFDEGRGLFRENGIFSGKSGAIFGKRTSSRRPPKSLEAWEAVNVSKRKARICTSIFSTGIHARLPKEHACMEVETGMQQVADAEWILGFPRITSCLMHRSRDCDASNPTCCMEVRNSVPQLTRCMRTNS